MDRMPTGRFSLTDDDYDRIDDAIGTAMGQHEALNNDSVCTCGVRNNMDGDVLFSHRWGTVVDAVHIVLENLSDPSAKVDG